MTALHSLLSKCLNQFLNKNGLEQLLDYSKHLFSLALLGLSSCRRTGAMSACLLSSPIVPSCLAQCLAHVIIFLLNNKQ